MDVIDRRSFALTLAAGAASLAGCARACPAPVAPKAPAPDAGKHAPVAPASKPAELAWVWRDEERSRLDKDRVDFDVVVRGCADSTVLRTRARAVPAGLDLSRIEARMLRTMLDSGGVGIAGPQVGLYLRVAVLQLDYKTDKPRNVFVRNPVIVERSDETAEGFEGCLSVPGVGGLVRRNAWIRVEHETEAGEIVSEEATAHNAVLWQHELDHLDGVLYLDRLLGELLPMEEVRRRRKEMEEHQGAGDQARFDYLEGASWLSSETKRV